MAPVLLFPTPFPDETITSLVTRYHRISGGGGVRGTLRDLFGAVTRSYTSDLPCHLSYLEAISGLDDLADRHTLLSYYEPFLTPDKAKRARALMASSRPVGLKMALGITASGFEQFRSTRYCPRCVAVDEATYGVSYWHVGHQATGVHICPSHHCFLRSNPTEVGRGTFNQLLLPHDVVERDQEHLNEPLPALYFAPLAEIADLVEWGRCNPRSIASLLDARYPLFIANRAGYINNGRLRASKLQDYFAYFSNVYPGEREYQKLFAMPKGKLSWPFSLLRERRACHHPFFFYIFLNCFHIDLPCLVRDTEEGARYMCPPSPKSFPSAAAVEKLELVARRNAFLEAYTTHLAKQSPNYSWLFRHDRTWLRKHIACNHKKLADTDRVDWSLRDHSMAERLRSAIERVRALPGRPVRLSLSALSRALSVPNDAFRQKNKLPQSTAIISISLESQHDFQIRKIHWAAYTIVQQDLRLSPALLLRKASIRVLHITSKEIDECIKLYSVRLHFFDESPQVSVEQESDTSE